MRSSGIAARELLLFLIACGTISGEKRDTELSSEHFLWNFHLTIRVGRMPVWETSEMNCLAKAVVISTLRVRDLEERVIG